MVAVLQIYETEPNELNFEWLYDETLSKYPLSEIQAMLEFEQFSNLVDQWKSISCRIILCKSL